MKQALRYTVLCGMLILLVGNVQAAGTGTLSFSSNPRSPDLYLVDSTGQNLRRLVTDNINKRTPTWSPDGHFFAYQSNDDGDPNIYVMDIRNKTSRQLTNHPIGIYRLHGLRMANGLHLNPTELGVYISTELM